MHSGDWEIFLSSSFTGKLTVKSVKPAVSAEIHEKEVSRNSRFNKELPNGICG